MKILEVASGDFFSSYGGGQVYVKNIVDEMIREKQDLAVISFINHQDDIIKEKNYQGVELYEISTESKDILQQLISRIHPDIIHAHSHKALITQIGNELQIPVVITAHHGGILCPAGTLMNSHDEVCKTSVSHRHCLRCVLRNTRTGLFWYSLMRCLPETVYIKLGEWLQRLPFILFVTPIGSAAFQIANKQKEWKIIAQGCSRMIAPCHQIAEAMQRNGLPKEKVEVLPHGIPLPTKVPSFPTISNGKIKFFYVGRICYVKGLHVLLEAFHHLKAPLAEMHLIGGTGNKAEKRYEQELKQRYQKDSRIIWHGKIAPEKVYETISEMHIAVSPAIYLEVFGLNIAEALAMGKPVLATLSGGAEMQIKDGVNGWLIAQNNVETMQKKMQEIVETFNEYDVKLSTSTTLSIQDHCEQLWKTYENELHKVTERNCIK